MGYQQQSSSKLLLLQWMISGLWTITNWMSMAKLWVILQDKIFNPAEVWVPIETPSITHSAMEYWLPELLGKPHSSFSSLPTRTDRKRLPKGWHNARILLAVKLKPAACEECPQKVLMALLYFESDFLKKLTILFNHKKRQGCPDLDIPG